MKYIFLLIIFFCSRLAAQTVYDTIPNVAGVVVDSSTGRQVAFKGTLIRRSDYTLCEVHKPRDCTLFPGRYWYLYQFILQNGKTIKQKWLTTYVPGGTISVIGGNATVTFKNLNQ